MAWRARARARVRASGAPLSVRNRLIVLSLCMVVLTSAVIGVFSVATMRTSLSERVDDQVASAFDRAADVVAGRGPTAGLWPELVHRDAPAVLQGPGQATGTLALVVVDGTLTAGYLGEDGLPRAIDGEELEALSTLDLDGQPHTISLGSVLGEYRAQGAAVNGTAVIVGLPLADVHRAVAALSWAIVLVALIGLVVLACIGTLLIRRALRPLEEVAEVADRVASQRLDRGAGLELERVAVGGVDERSEVGRVLNAVNSMMANVEQALNAREASEQRVRRFVADASHELRTPLSSIRGYSELVRRVSEELPDDVRTSLGRIEAESIRMQTLVEDLLLLARLDEGRALRSETVDLAAVVRNALGDAAVVDDEREWELLVPEQPVLMTGDPAALHQVVANLLQNARAHTPPGTSVCAALTLQRESDIARALGSEGIIGVGAGLATGGNTPESVSGRREAHEGENYEGDKHEGNNHEGEQRWGVLSVVDTGPGLSEGLDERVFRRFVRGAEHRTRAGVNRESGSGLGLSIVAAIAEAHGGTVGVQSAPGRTEFWVRFPLVIPQGADESPEAARALVRGVSEESGEAAAN